MIVNRELGLDAGEDFAGLLRCCVVGADAF
jgi:hypothetical protein